jgi:hypothetical protein
MQAAKWGREKRNKEGGITTNLPLHLYISRDKHL